MIAFVDESIRQNVDLYVLGCVIAPCAEYDDLKDFFFNGPRFHFRHANEEHRQRMLTSICEKRLGTSGYVARGFSEKRARALCLEALLWDMKQVWDACEIVIESRQVHNDVHDQRVILGARQRGIASKELRYGWEPGASNSMLWTADAVAGVLANNATLGTYGEFLTDRKTPIKSIGEKKRTSPGSRYTSVARAPLPRS